MLRNTGAVTDRAPKFVLPKKVEKSKSTGGDTKRRKRPQESKDCGFDTPLFPPFQLVNPAARGRNPAPLTSKSHLTRGMHNQQISLPLNAIQHARKSDYLILIISKLGELKKEAKRGNLFEV
jgi:hypothetical protein